MGTLAQPHDRPQRVQTRDAGTEGGEGSGVVT